MKIKNVAKLTSLVVLSFMSGLIVHCLLVAKCQMYNDYHRINGIRFHTTQNRDFSPPDTSTCYYSGHISRIIDGDTIDIVVNLGYNVCILKRFRLLGINAPEITGKEKSQGLQSKIFIEKLLRDKTITVATNNDKYDKYGRVLAVIYADGTNINQIMLDSGYATKYEE